MKSILLIVFLFLNGCSFLQMKCSPWIPIIGIQSIMNKDINQAIKESSAGTKCEIQFN